MTDAPNAFENRRRLYRAVERAEPTIARDLVGLELDPQRPLHVDPLMKGEGSDGIDAMIAGVQQRFPDFEFALLGKARRPWQLRPLLVGTRRAAATIRSKGTDFVVTDSGRISSVTGFLDQMPADLSPAPTTGGAEQPRRRCRQPHKTDG